MKTVDTITTEFLNGYKSVVEIKRLGNGNIVYVLMEGKKIHLFHGLENLVKGLGGDMSGKLCTLPEGIDPDKFLLDAQVMFS